WRSPGVSIVYAEHTMILFICIYFVSQKDQEVFVFTSIDDVQSRLTEQQYVSNRKLATVVFLVTRMNKMILMEGPAGVGKTEMAKVLAKTLDRPQIRLQCNKGLDDVKALYARA